MKGLLRALLKRLLVVAGIVVIALAVLLGAARLLIANLPGYQDELRAWVTDALGVEASFAEFDARLGLYGPELDLRDVSLREAGVTRDFLDAARASLTLDPMALLLRQRVAISRLTVDGASFAIERTTDNQILMQGLTPAAGSLGDFGALLPASVDVVIRDSQVLYIDRIERHFWQFADLDIELERDDDGLTATASAAPPEELAERIELTATRAEGESALRLRARLDAINLAALTRMMPDPAWQDFGGTGDVDLSASWQDGRLFEAEATVDVAHLSVSARGDPDYDRLSFTANWLRAGDEGFAVAVDGLDVVRGGRAWPGGGKATVSVADDADVVGIAADFVRLEDLTPLVDRFAPPEFVSTWQALGPHGDLDALQLSTDAGPDGRDFTLEGGFSQVGIAPHDDWPGFEGIDGEIRAGAGAGTLSFSSGTVALDWPWLLSEKVAGAGLRGTVVWRRGQDGLRILSDDLSVDLFGEPLVANFELALPDDGSPYLDLNGRLAGAAITDAKTLLPRRGLPNSVLRWLQAALVGGNVRDVTVEFTGSLDAFPFDNGDGRFLVRFDAADTTLDYIPGWPLAEDLDGEIRFENAGFGARGAGRVLDSPTENLSVAIVDMRKPVLEIDATLDGPLGDVLGFVQTAPLITRHLGQGFDLLQAVEGSAATTLDLDLPLLSFADFTLASRLDITGGRLRIEGFAPEASEISGALEIMNTSVSGAGITGVFLGGPVTAEVAPASEPGYRTVLDVRGEATSDAVFDAFSLPLGTLVDGQTLWSGRLSLPRTESESPGPLSIDIESNLSGVALRFPAPLAKAPGEPVNLLIGFVFEGDGALAVSGNLGAGRRYAFMLDRKADRFELSRGAITFGGDDPRLPLRNGIEVAGRIQRLRLDDWLEISKTGSIERARPLFYSADLDIGEFEAFGQQLGETSLTVQRGDRIWDIGLDSAAIAGHIEIPQNLEYRAPVIADMDRVYLAVGEAPADPDSLDPRQLPGLRLRAAEFGIGSRELGRVEADVVADPLGLRLTSFASATDSYSLEASGSWLTDGARSTSRIAATVTSSDVALTLNQLGIDPIVEGESGELTASIYWDGPPSSGWLDHLYGDVALSISTGTLTDLDPGAGRVVGLMSIAALPRRLTLDFRDVFNKGLSFDEITGSFMIDDGNAYTDNLKLSGPVAEIGVIGRTGLRDRDYQQQAVVTAEPSNMLPTVGGLLGGPGVGAALLIFTRIFKEPLKGIGRASYCVTGSWDEPNVERITPERAEGVEQCVSMPEPLAGNGDGG